jgi:crotonobetaine/carnitine-CoA ligase
MTMIATAAERLSSTPPAEQTLSALLVRQAAIHGDKVLLRSEVEQRTYEGMRDRASLLAGTLRAAGVNCGDRVAMLTDEAVPLADLWFACGWLGAVLVPLNTASREPQLAHALTDSAAVILAVDAELLGTIRGIPELPSSLTRIWVLGDTGDTSPIRGIPVTCVPEASNGVERYPVGPDDPAAIIYTSGTTGPAKGVICPHAQWLWFAANAIDALEIVEQDVLYTCLPLFHVNGLSTIVEALDAGATCVKGPKFSASRFWDRLAHERATVTFILGVMVALAGATPANLAAAFIERFGIELVDGYASTETNMVMRNTGPDFRPGMIGRVAPRFQAMVVDTTDRQVQDGVPGELVVRALDPWAFSSGYLGLPERTLESRRNFWFHTGDRVVREPDGWFRFVDRMNDAIRRRGENVSAFEIEQVIESHPDVTVAAAFAVPSDIGEDEIMVSLVAKTDELRPEALLEWCSPRLPAFALPRYVDVVESLPLTQTGKVTKSPLRDRGVTGGTYDREKFHRRPAYATSWRRT